MARRNQTLTFDKDAVGNLDSASLYSNRDAATQMMNFTTTEVVRC